MENLLLVLTSFETMDALAGPGERIEAVAPLVRRLARAATGLERSRPAPSGRGSAAPR